VTTAAAGDGDMTTAQHLLVTGDALVLPLGTVLDYEGACIMKDHSGRTLVKSVSDEDSRFHTARALSKWTYIQYALFHMKC
jgi:hypothetical protein